MASVRLACLTSFFVGIVFSASAEDASVLLQSAVHKHTGNVSDACRCLNWKEVYDSGVMCGSGVEMDSFENGVSLGMGICRDNFFTLAFGEGGSAFFPKQNHSYCVRRRKSMKSSTIEEERGDWCYVSEECTELNGGRRKRQDGGDHEWIAYKNCTAEDPALKDLSPAELFALASKQKVDHVGMASFAYPWVAEYVWKLSFKKPLKKYVSCMQSGEACPGMGNGNDMDSYAFRFKQQIWVWSPTQYNTSCVSGCEGLEVTSVLRSV